MNNRKVYFVLFVSVLVDTIGFGLILPLLPFYALKFGSSASSSGFFLCRPLLNSLLSQSVGAKQQGEILGIAESVSTLGRIIGPIGAGFLFGSLGSDWPFWSGTIVMAVASIFGWQVATASNLSSAISKQRQRKMKKLFNLLAHNKNGVIEPIDFEQGFQAIAEIRGWTQDSPDYWIVHSFWIGLQRKMQSLMDTDGDGRITIEEWLEYMTSRLDHDFADSFTKIIDSNEDGEDSLDKLKMYYQGYKINTNNGKAVFEEFDINRDGNISLEEISEILDQFMYSDELKESVTLAVAS